MSADDVEAAAIGRAHGSRSVGTAADATFTMTDVALSRSSVSFTLHGPEGVLGAVGPRACPGCTTPAMPPWRW